MRKVSFDPANQSGIDQDEWKHWKDKAEKAEQAMLDWFEKKNGTPAGTVVSPQPEFKEDIWKKLKNLIFKPVFAGRCAYCEAKVTVVAWGDADHYRPKNEATEKDANGVRQPIKIGHEKHPGYPWLAYDWQNLIPACPICNNHKLTLFPIAGSRCAKPESGQTTTKELNAYEQPLLLHPYLDDPKSHLHFDESGVIVAKNRDPRGQATIDICWLDREDLREDRHEAQLAAWNRASLQAHEERKPVHRAIKVVVDQSNSVEFSRAVIDYLYMKLDEEIANLERSCAEALAIKAARNANTNS